MCYLELNSTPSRLSAAIEALEEDEVEDEVDEEVIVEEEVDGVEVIAVVAVVVEEEEEEDVVVTERSDLERINFRFRFCFLGSVLCFFCALRFENHTLCSH